jgi:hypothetical protein
LIHSQIPRPTHRCAGWVIIKKIAGDFELSNGADHTIPLAKLNTVFLASIVGVYELGGMRRETLESFLAGCPSPSGGATSAAMLQGCKAFHSSTEVFRARGSVNAQS